MLQFFICPNYFYITFKTKRFKSLYDIITPLMPFSTKVTTTYKEN